MLNEAPSLEGFEAAVRSEECVSFLIERHQSGMNFRYLCDAMKRETDGGWETFYQIIFDHESKIQHEFMAMLEHIQNEGIYTPFEQAEEVKFGVVRQWWKRQNDSGKGLIQ